MYAGATRTNLIAAIAADFLTLLVFVLLASLVVRDSKSSSQGVSQALPRCVLFEFEPEESPVGQSGLMVRFKGEVLSNWGEVLSNWPQPPQSDVEEVVWFVDKADGYRVVTVFLGEAQGLFEVSNRSNSNQRATAKVGLASEVLGSGVTGIAVQIPIAGSVSWNVTQTGIR